MPICMPPPDLSFASLDALARLEADLFLAARALKRAREALWALPPDEVAESELPGLFAASGHLDTAIWALALAHDCDLAPLLARADDSRRDAAQGFAVT